MIRTLIVMGVAGSGKSTLGAALAQSLQWSFLEGDTLHPPANVEKMTRGQALDDSDREPFLDNIAQAIATRPPHLVISCSVLKRSYRDRLRRVDPQLVLVHPVLTREQLQGRLALRPHHFMPASLLDSQLHDLEAPGVDERCIELDGMEPVNRQVTRTLAQFF